MTLFSSGLRWWFCENISLTKIWMPPGLRLLVPLTMTILFITFQICLNDGTHRSDVTIWYLSSIAPEHTCLPFFLIDTTYGCFVISTSPSFCVISAPNKHLMLLSKDKINYFFLCIKIETFSFKGNVKRDSNFNFTLYTMQVI